jgi:5-methylcytosine-specific restriction endonuclease McrA
MAGHWSHDRAYRINRAILLRTSRREQAPCSRCGGPIDYDGPRYIRLSGRRHENPAAFDAGHIIAIIEGGTHALDNLQAEHARCNRSAGAHLGNARRARPGRTRPQRPGHPAAAPITVLILDDW